MSTFLLRRLLLLVPVVWGVSTLVFLFLHFIPGDPVIMMVGETAEPSAIEETRQRLGLDRPLPVQYVSFLGRLLVGDLGTSIHSERPVTRIIGERMPATILLTITSLLVAAAIAIPAGMHSARKRGSLGDAAVTFLAFLGLSLPNFWLGPLLIIVFSIQLGWLPVSGTGSVLHLVLPSITLGTALAAFLTRMVRSSLLDVLEEPYIRTALSKGLAFRNVYYRHALRNAMIPVITLMTLQLGGLLGGSVITETIFGWPGIGREMLLAIQRRDYPVVQGCVLVIAFTYVFVNLLADILYSLTDPRIRLDGGSA